MYIEKHFKNVQNDVLHAKNPNLSNSRTVTLSVPNIKCILSRMLNVIH